MADASDAAPDDPSLTGPNAPVGWMPRAMETPPTSPLTSVGAPILNTPPSSAAAAAQSASPLVGGSGGVAPSASPQTRPSILFGLDPNARGMQNNNPGNLEANAFTASLPGYVGSDGRFARFASPEQGIAALKRNLGSYAARGISTPLDVASTWAPGSEKGNDPGSYGASIAKELGVRPGDRIDLMDPLVQDKVAAAIARVENGTTKAGESSAPTAKSAQSAMASSPSEVAPSNPAGVIADQMKLAMLRGMFPQHAISPVEHDPFKAVVPGLDTKVNVNQGVS